MNRTRTLFSGPSVKVMRFDHPEHCVHKDEGPEVTQAFDVSMVEKGEFDLLERRQRWHFRPFDVIVTCPGAERTYSHAEQCPTDVCLSVVVLPEIMEEGMGRLPTRPLPRVAGGATSRFLFGRMLRALNSADPMAIECAAFDCTLSFGADFRKSTASERGLDSHSRRIGRACEWMVTNLAEGQSLSSVSHEVGMSAFHFARIFRNLVGQSPHQYLMRARLAHAARQLRQGVSVTEAALISGFGNLSHFTRLFGRRFGMTPGEYSSGSSRRLTTGAESRSPAFGLPGRALTS